MKRDAELIIAHLKQIKKADWLGGSQRWWPDYLYHYTDINNAANILNAGLLLSREQAELAGYMINDNASPDVITQTDARWRKYVRFYFRPRTPTQYRNEGFRPVDKLELGGAHCPVPVYLFFDSASILTMKESLFTSGTLASNYVKPMNTASEFTSIPFRTVYHDSWFYPEQRDTIVHNRHAEVIIPDRIGLAHLKLIYCRSDAEFESLIDLLEGNVKNNWIAKIGVATKINIFNKTWAFVEKVDLNSNQIKFTFNKNSIGPFHVRATIIEHATGKHWYWEENNFYTRDTNISISNIPNSNFYTVKLYLDNRLAYSYTFNDTDMPF